MMNTVLDDDFDSMLEILFGEEKDSAGNNMDGKEAAEETPTTPPVLDESSTTALLSLMISELDCPVCLQLMLSPLHLPLLCPNGHACCSSCSTRVKRICPICRSSNIRWTRCLTLERVGSLLVKKGQLIQQEPPEQEYIIDDVDPHVIPEKGESLVILIYMFFFISTSYLFEKLSFGFARKYLEFCLTFLEYL